jgi:hypothetical protein
LTLAVIFSLSEILEIVPHVVAVEKRYGRKTTPPPAASEETTRNFTVASIDERIEQLC